MSKYNLKNNPELARQRHAEQQRAYYQRNKEYIIAMQREYRTKKNKFEIPETQVEYGYIGMVCSDGKLHTVYPDQKDSK